MAAKSNQTTQDKNKQHAHHTRGKIWTAKWCTWQQKQAIKYNLTRKTKLKSNEAKEKWTTLRQQSKQSRRKQCYCRAQLTPRAAWTSSNCSAKCRSTKCCSTTCSMKSKEKLPHAVATYESPIEDSIDQSHAGNDDTGASFLQPCSWAINKIDQEIESDQHRFNNKSMATKSNQTTRDTK